MPPPTRRIIYFQNASTIASFNVNWSQLLVEYPFWALAVVNFDVAFLSPNCSWPSWSYGHGLALQFLLPLIIMGICAANYFANLLLVSLFKVSGMSSGINAFEVDEASMEPQVVGMLGFAMRTIGFATTPSKLEEARDRYISISTSFINAVGSLCRHCDLRRCAIQPKT